MERYKPTYSVSLEFRPIDSLLFRGKYGTALRAPTLSDAFQGVSGYYANGSTDYYRCGQLGYDPANTTGCPYDSVSVFGTQSGNPDLEPITAGVWNAGIVWAPINNLSVSVVQDIGRFGALQFSSNYTNMIKRELQPQPGDDYLDLLRDPYAMWNYDQYARVRADGSIGWAKDKWATTLYANYIGKTPNYMAYLGNGYDDLHSSGYKAGKWGSYTTYNLSVNYRAMNDLTLSLMVYNVSNKMPDNQRYSFSGTSGQPYNNYLYNAYGRAIYVQAKYEFGNN